MEKNFSQPPNQEQTRIAPIKNQTFPWSEGQDDWSLRDFLGIVRRRFPIIVGVTIGLMATFVGWTLHQKPEYEGNFRLLVEPLNNDSKLPNLTAGTNSNLPASGLDYESQIQVLKSPEIITSIVKQLQATHPDINYDSVAKSLTITRLGETKILEVSYRHQNSLSIKVVLNQTAQTYLNYSLQKRQTRLRQGLQFIGEQLFPMQNRVENLQKELQTFRQKYNFTDPETQTTQITNQVQSLSAQRQAVNQQLATAHANFRNLQAKDGEVTALNSAAVYQQLIAQLRQLDIQIAGESTRFQDNNPSIQALKEKREKLSILLRQEAQRFVGVKVAEVTTQVQTLEVQSQELAKLEKQLEEKRQLLPVLYRQYIELQRTLQIATESLNRFLTTRETLQIEAAQTELPWELVQKPTILPDPISPNIARSLVSSLLGSIFLGIAIALLIEKLDNTYHTVDALKDKIQLPLLGAIPFEKQLHSQHRHLKSITPIAISDILSQHIPGLAPTPQGDSNYSSKFLEALRVVYTNLQLLSSDRPIRSIVISSAMFGDGKSTVAFHLAQIAAAMGQRVLLVDADMRRPMIHTLSNLNNLSGLSNLISQNLPTTEVIRQLPLPKRLFTIAAGSLPPDPTKLLAGEKMKRFMADFHQSFDLVIYDAPPLLGLADASLLAPHTDGILLVVKMDKTDVSVMKRALDRMKTSRINILGVVGNCQKRDFNGSYNDY